MKAFFPFIIIAAVVWFIITWVYISLNLFDGVVTFNEKLITFLMLVEMFIFGVCLGGYLTDSKTEVKAKEQEDLLGFVPQKNGRDNLQLIEGIGPKIEEVLRLGGIDTFRKLEDSSQDSIKNILNKAGKQFALVNPKTWGEQAELVNQRDWKGLQKYQDFLVGGL